MRISDWSSDVCSSDLVVEHVDPEAVSGAPREPRLEVAAEIVIAQNVDLQQKVVLCRFDRLEHGGKGFLAVLQQLDAVAAGERQRSEEHTSELQSLMRISYAVFCLKKKKKHKKQHMYTNAHN